MKTSSLFAILGVPALALAAPLFADEPGIVAGSTPFAAGTRYTFQSAILDQDRAIRVFTPPPYQDDPDSYPVVPVLYVLDGDVHYLPIAGLVQMLSWVARDLPPMVVVGIEPIDRVSELLPRRHSRPASPPEDCHGSLNTWRRR